MFNWIRKLFTNPVKGFELEKLPDLGFLPRFYDLDDAPRSSVIVSIENDDETPMEFVVQVLRDYFGMPLRTATEVMLEVHVKGSADIRAMSRRDADRLVRRIREEAVKHPYPLQCGIRPIEQRHEP